MSSRPSDIQPDPSKKGLPSAQDTPSEVLLHACCAPCSSAIVEWMLSRGIRLTIFYFNPNIYPEKEYLIRKNESKRHADSLGIPWIDGDYDHQQWLADIKGLENEPERGSRCLQCFRIRLLATAHKAKELGITWFATTLASSRWKSLEQINEAGLDAASQVPPTRFWAQNWRKGGLQERRNQLLREYNFYNQQYCGCEFSMPSAPTPNLQSTTLYRVMKTTSRVMDRFYLDGLLGLIPGGIGDLIGGIFTLIHVYFASFRLRSWRLTLAVLNNALRDVMLGLLPFFVGDFIDFFHRANRQNMRLIDGFIQGDKEIIREVNRKALQSATACLLLLLTIILLICLLIWLANKLGTILFC